MLKIFFMMRQRRTKNIYSETMKDASGRLHGIDENDVTMYSPAIKRSLIDYIKFAFFCMLLIVPVYAIAISAIKHDWAMMIIDALLVPVGLVHGLLLLFGYVN
jgi:hypothetical protein